MSINTRLATLERAATPIESAKVEQARRLIDLLLRDARLIASGETPDTRYPAITYHRVVVRRLATSLAKPSASNRPLCHCWRSLRFWRVFPPRPRLGHRPRLRRARIVPMQPDDDEPREITWRDAWLFVLLCAAIFALFGWLG